MSPESSVEMLRLRAELLARSREFFATQGVLEVDTAILGSGLVVESEIDPIPCQVSSGPGTDSQTRHLLSSPEGPMKRLLAAGSGAIYQFAHAFRDGEDGRRHSPEFCILEWYRPGFDHHDLMAEVEALVKTLIPSLQSDAFQTCRYRDLFLDATGIDPFDTSLAEIRSCCDRLAIPAPSDFETRSLDDALDLLLVAQLEPKLGQPVPIFVHDYPASQAALAQVYTNEQGHELAQRFELYIHGIELANGYHELSDPVEQVRRFEAANRDRLASGRSELPRDTGLIRALEHGLPACAGVALGFDRLMMIASGTDHIQNVRGLPFADETTN